MEDIHNRMPVVLEDDTLDEWLDPGQPGQARSSSRCWCPSPAGTLVHRPVGTAVGNVRNDGPELTEAVAD